MRVAFIIQRFYLSILLVLSCLVMAEQAQAGANLNLVSSTTNSRLPKAEHSFPFPDDGNQTFFIQRSMNSNTVVYALRFDANGTLDRRRPVNAYWRRFNDEGEVAPLGFVERSFAYGVRSKQDNTANTFRVTFVALPDLKVQLRQTAPNKAALWAKIGDHDFQLIYGFLELDESGMVPKVVGLRLYSRDPQSNKYVTHRYSVSDGAIRE